MSAQKIIAREERGDKIAIRQRENNEQDGKVSTSLSVTTSNANGLNVVIKRHRVTEWAHIHASSTASVGRFKGGRAPPLSPSIWS